ncbi:MAG: tRNA (guanosine(46)-N7)-methyltransferase TrmB [Thermodesulfovibrio sp.]|nr:tRNA (guanosine(46)-N7)-methyltransferase TrmB [Thermodesulfovibrio sp.]MDW7998997.1 tRNA (guanosine(46)-N7)-methyltransferase TrmB [Thermodesulfovibrio sp.]
MQNYIDYRKAQKPLNFENFTVEIGFGSGDFLIKLAEQNKDEIFFGIEKSWIPVNKLLKKCKLRKINNIYCIRLDAYWAFQLLFKDKSVKKIIINYPDPWFKKSHFKKRVTKRENLFIYAKKLLPSGEIKIRTDDYPFVVFTLQESEFLKCFSATVSNPSINEPLTKYEKKWLSIGKNIWDIVLKKEKEPESIEIKQIMEVKELFPLKICKGELNINAISHKEFRIEDDLYLRCFSVWQREQDYALEVVLLEKDFLQAFFITAKNKGEYFIIDVSKFSEILKTEGVQKALNFLAKLFMEVL